MECNEKVILKAGQVLHRCESFQTGPDAKVVVVYFEDKRMVKIRPNTQFTVEPLDPCPVLMHRKKSDFTHRMLTSVASVKG